MKERLQACTLELLQYTRLSIYIESEILSLCFHVPEQKLIQKNYASDPKTRYKIQRQEKMNI